VTEPTNNPYARDSQGRFGPDNKGGPGGARQRMAWRQALEKAATPERLDMVARKLTLLALEGNTRAMQMLLDRTAGRPAEAPSDPDALDLALPELTTTEACGRATDVIIAAIATGRLDREVADTFLDAIRVRLQTLAASSAPAEAGAERPPELPPMPTPVLLAWFTLFQKTGELPEDEVEAATVVNKVKAGFTVAKRGEQHETPGAWFDGFVPRPRAEDAATDALLDEAVNGSPVVRAAARHVLWAFAKCGFDVTTAILDNFEVPEFGGVGLMMLGFPQRLAKRPFAAQADRLFDRMEAVQATIPKQRRACMEWRQRVDQALVLFQHGGVRPDDEEMLEVVLVTGELATLCAHWEGEKVDDLLQLFDTAARSSGPEREAAIEALAAMARAGRFRFDPTACDAPREVRRRRPRRGNLRKGPRASRRRQLGNGQPERTKREPEGDSDGLDRPP
jgi:hypothetical protein